MDTFDAVFDKAKDALSAAGKKTGEVVEASKLKLKCVQLNGKIRQAYEKLGETVYGMRKNGFDNQAAVDSLTEEIGALLQELDAVSAKVADLKHMIICPSCGKKNPNDAYFCLQCGSRIAAEFGGEYANVAADYEAEQADSSES